jgi:hypothetical protein
VDVRVMPYNVDQLPDRQTDRQRLTQARSTVG